MQEMKFMENLKLNKNRSICLTAIILIVAAQAAQKILQVVIEPTLTFGVICAIVYTIIVAVVYFLLCKETSSFLGILAALLALKMLPPSITHLVNVSADAAMVYFLVQKMSQILFAVLVYKFYCAQEKPRAIKALPVLLIIIAVPFTNQIAEFAGSYFLFKTGSMIVPYFVQYICYAAAALVILIVSYKCGRESMRFAAYFQFCAFGINMFRMLGKLGYFIIAQQHISKSIYGWVFLFAVLIVAYAIALKKSDQLTE